MRFNFLNSEAVSMETDRVVLTTHHSDRCLSSLIILPKDLFTLVVSVCVCVWVNVQHCVNVNVKNGFRPILCVCVCASIDAMLNFDGDCDANVNCEHTLTPVGITDVAHPGFVRRGVCLTFWLHFLENRIK